MGIGIIGIGVGIISAALRVDNLSAQPCQVTSSHS